MRAYLLPITPKHSGAMDVETVTPDLGDPIFGEDTAVERVHLFPLNVF